jgi:hypothetical protein
MRTPGLFLEAAPGFEPACRGQLETVPLLPEVSSPRLGVPRLGGASSMSWISPRLNNELRLHSQRERVGLSGDRPALSTQELPQRIPAFALINFWRTRWRRAWCYFKISSRTYSVPRTFLY